MDISAKRLKFSSKTINFEGELLALFIATWGNHGTDQMVAVTMPIVDNAIPLDDYSSALDRFLFDIAVRWPEWKEHMHPALEVA